MSHLLQHPAARTQLGYGPHDDAIMAAYHAELQQKLQAAKADAAPRDQRQAQAHGDTTAGESRTTVEGAARGPAAAGPADVGVAGED
jgi:hypothetical protein